MADPVFNYVATNPFGLNGVGLRAAPDLVDIDGDGDLDAFVGNLNGDTSFFKNTGTTSNPIFVAAVTNPFGLNNMGGDNPTFVDIDGDSDLDALVGRGDGVTLFYKNTGTAASPAFAAAIISPFGLSGVGFGADPTFVDIDGDGDLDAFVGDYYGNTQFFKNTGTVNNPIFAAAVTNPFGLSDAGGYASPTFADIDGDGDLDVFVGNGHYTGSSGTWFFRNVGTINNPTFYRDNNNPFGLSNVGGSYTNPTFADIDDDSDLDVFVGNNSGSTLFFQNTGIGTNSHFSWDDAFGLNNAVEYTDFTFVDIDGDGDLDAFAGNSYYYYDAGGDTLFFENTGTINNPVFAAASTNPFGLDNVGSFSSPTFVDIDGDGDMDAFVGDEAGNMHFFENTGITSNPMFAAAVTNPFGLSDAGNFASPTFADIDADGDQDAFVNNMFFQNTGTASSPVFAAPQANPFGLTGSDFTFVDFDRDGDLDAFANNTQFFRNTGSASNPAFSYAGSSPAGLPGGIYRGSITSQTFVDIDGDGDLDAYVNGTYSYSSVSAWGGFLANNNAPNVANLTVPETYTKNTPLNLANIVISDPDSANVTATLKLSNVAAGSLSTGTSGAVTSTFNASTGTWTASGALADVNALLAGVIFTPVTNFSGAFTINTSISDGVASPLLGSKNFTVDAAGVLLTSTSGNDILTGTSSINDTVTYASATGPVTVSLNITTQQNTIGAGLDTITKVENLIGSAFGDSLTGDATDNVLDGKAGNDTLIGWSGADTMIGGLGNDTYFVENAGDIVTEKLNQGTDTVSSRLAYTLPVNVENLILTGTAVIDGTGNNLNNVITGNNAANQLNGDTGNDTLKGGAGNDTLIGWSGADTMVGGSGNDTYFVENVGDIVTEKLNQGTDTVSSRLTYTLSVNVENLILTGSAAANGTGNSLANTITGNSAANRLSGLTGNDTLNGGGGNDVLNGGAGTNTLTGGAGKDIFLFATAAHNDTVTDYSVANDTIQLENAVFTALTATGTLAAGQFKVGTKALDANDHIIYNNAAGTLLYDADGNGVGASVQIATVGTGLAMTNAEFVVI
ncbi:hemolysin type calcium-binding protein [Nitrosomonas sp. Nm84]|uniref:beta strand repeat-containing protein n=1 Tax=Nitrosomonas sp. Nm84 TaxID=200124 RepID=UPI000D752F4A|nr:FG-GAP-like repeat-containing protein [Nitrosomonas sp. Nm84]PXW89911.1 hemolysin type calcium-binding protein [Nitrosomonas sp. Nm84]